MAARRALGSVPKPGETKQSFSIWAFMASSTWRLEWPMLMFSSPEHPSMILRPSVSYI
jgi:hypothetical protein